MEIPNICKGHLYPSARVPRCPRFHRCTVTNKCQNYDRHLLECNVCESRTNTHELDAACVPLGGHLAEGEFYPDLQDAIATLERMLGKAFAHPDNPSQTLNSRDIARNWEREAKVTEMVKTFSSIGALNMDEKIMEALVDEDTARLLGRLE
jgi:hypothetical protein